MAYRRSFRGGALPLPTLPRRDVNPRWVTEGRITENDCCSWLRESQVEGREICLIGSTPAACQVCVEAYRSGFKPVLILLMDKVELPVKDELDKMVKDLKTCRFRTGMLDCGFDVRTIDSQQVTLKVDSSGQARDVNVAIPSRQRSIGRISWVSRSTSLSFPGPVLVLGQVVEEEMLNDEQGLCRESTDEPPAEEPEPNPGSAWATQPRKPSPMAELPGPSWTGQPLQPPGPQARSSRQAREPGIPSGLSAHHKLMVLETEQLTDPKFWEQRYDPSCLPLVTPTYLMTILIFAIQVPQLACSLCAYRFYDEPFYAFARVALNIPWLVPSAIACCMCFGVILGLEVPNRWMTDYAVRTGLLTYVVCSMVMLFQHKGFIASDFLMSSFVINCGAPFVLIYAYKLTTLKITKWSLAWYTAGMLASCGTWILSLPTTLLYQFILSHSGAAASVYLSFAFFALESGMVRFATMVHEKVVLEPRRRDPTCVPGDTKYGISIIFMVVHTVLEVARFGTLLCGAVVAKDAGFLANATLSMLTSLVINTASRTAALNKVMVRVPLIGRFFCPNSCWCAHANAKFTCGWSRYFSALGVMLGRGLIHWDWSVPWLVEPGREGCWCWSGVVLLTAALGAAQELAEDVITHSICMSQAPVPHSPVYLDVTRQRLEAPRTANRFHTKHYYIPPPAEKSDKKYVLCPNLTNVRTFAFTFYLVLGTPCSIVLMTILCVGLGSGNVLGFCRPLLMEEDDIVLFLRNAIVWTTHCDF